MARSKQQKRERYLQFLRYSLIMICTGGFLYQTLGFMFIYWTYPTVISIQKSEPGSLEMPAFTICNAIGYNYTTLCNGFRVPSCYQSSFNKYMAKQICGTNLGTMCYNGKINPNFQLIIFSRFSEEARIRSEDHDRLRIPLESYFKCEIEFFGKKQPCNMDYVMGSLYSVDDLPQYCYTIYSLWGNPSKKREVVEKGTVMRFRFQLNASLSNETVYEKIRPKHNMPSSPTVQLAVHSPYTLPSPTLEGANYLGGRAYKIRINMNQNTLLPAPYQTNCTDYLDMWKKRGGKAPMNQMGMINECRLEKYNEVLGCIPLNLDYPHSYGTCRKCKDKCNDTVVNLEECTKLSNHYNQPCSSTFYTVIQSEKEIPIPFKLKSLESELQQRNIMLKIPNYKCEGNFLWSTECSTVEIDVLFDNFEVTSLRYNPKYESLEVFSAIGGYLGMWLGISLVTMSDFIGYLQMKVSAFRKRRKRRGLRQGRLTNTRSNLRDFQGLILSTEHLN